jgi:hypothetical protein
MKREICKFLAGAVAALAYGHAVYAVLVSRGTLTSPSGAGGSGRRNTCGLRLAPILWSAWDSHTAAGSANLRRHCKSRELP